MKYIIKRHDGFTLIETMVAMVIFTIGILALFGMQTAAIKENLAANSITTGATLASDRIEQLIALNYADNEISEGGGAGINKYASCDDLSSDNWREIVSDEEKEVEAFLGETAGQPDYFLYWAVSQGCTLVNTGGVGLADDSPYRPKHLYITVTRDNGNGEEEVTAAFSYIKQNPNY